MTTRLLKSLNCFRRAKTRLPIHWSLCVLVVLHVVGVAGFAMQLRGFDTLVPTHLLITALIWVINQRVFTRQLCSWLCGAALAGFGVEVLGVKSEMVFGAYYYGPALGPRAWDVPLLMGLNWALLLAVSGGISGSLASDARPPVRAALGATLLVLLDLVLEPFAIAHGLWTWEGAAVPLRNYVAWWLVSFLLLLPDLATRVTRENSSVAWIYGCFMLFFSATNVLS